MLQDTEKPADLSPLIQKRDQLLAELKAARARITALEAERDAATAKTEQSVAALRRFRLETPLEEIAIGMIDLPARYAVALVRDHFDFDLGPDGEVIARTKAEPRTVPFTREGIFDAAQGIPELRGRFFRPEGPAATGGLHRRGNMTLPRAEPVKALPLRLGLR